MLNVRQHGSVLQLTIDRRERRNALGTEIVEALGRALREAATDPEIGGVVINGSAPGFSAGSDLKELAALDLDGMVRHETRTAEVARSITRLEKPVVAAVSGFAIGGGCFLAASCDLVVTADDARWHLPEVSLGWIPPWGFAALVARVGLATARRLTLATSPMTGRDAASIGLADVLVAAASGPDATLQAAMQEAERMARLPRAAVAATKLFFAALIGRDAEELDETAMRAFRENCRSPEAVVSLNGPMAPRQRRPAFGQP